MLQTSALPVTTLIDPVALMIVALACLTGAVIKGATGAGLPILTVPAIAMVYDVRMAVVILVVPNFFTNVWQIYKYRKQSLHPKLCRNFVLAGCVGVGVGSVLLSALPEHGLNLVLGVILVVYIGLRILKPDFQIPIPVATRFAWLGGGGGGILQGAVGLSAPIAVTFLNAAKLPRAGFIFTISAFFATICLVQMPVQIAVGLVNAETVALGFMALVPILLGLPLGERIGQRMSPILFDRVILAMLSVLALIQIYRAIQMC